MIADLSRRGPRPRQSDMSSRFSRLARRFREAGLRSENGLRGTCPGSRRRP
jgi:hypothetical protein